MARAFSARGVTLKLLHGEYVDTAAAAGDLSMVCAVRRSARDFVAADPKRKVWAYNFHHTPEKSVNVPSKQYLQLIGAFHGAEVPFVWHDLFELEGDERALSEQMATYWLNFARTGDVNGGGNLFILRESMRSERWTSTTGL